MFDIVAVECQQEIWPGMEPVEGKVHVYRDTESGLFYWVDETGDLSEAYVTAEEAEAVLDKYCIALSQEYYGDINAT